MNNKWKVDVERIHQATKLTISLFSCSEHEWAKKRRQYESVGGKIVKQEISDGTVWYVGIVREEWPESARALLPLLLSEQPQSPEASADDPFAVYLHSVYVGVEPSPIHKAPSWQWTEPLACFLLERTAAESGFEQAEWMELFSNFFSSHHSLRLLSLTSKDILLLVPLSYLPGVEQSGKQSEQIWLDWAAGLHSLLYTEMMERVRVTVAPPVSNLDQLTVRLGDFSKLTQAIHRFSPGLMVAATWLMPLERWILSLDHHIREALQQSLHERFGVLQEEQLSTLQIFFHHHLNSSEAARALFLHRNTLLYRLDKLKEQTGLDPRQFPDAVLLYLYVLFRQNV